MNNVSQPNAEEIPDVATERENGNITQAVLDDASFQVNIHLSVATSGISPCVW